MKTKNSYFLIILYSTLYFGCDKKITDVELDYEEKLVVQGILEAGQPVKNIRIMRTLPALEYYPLEDYFVTNATVTILRDNETFNLHYNKDGYYDTDSLIAIPGKEYAINIFWNGKKVSGKTIIPYPASIERVFYDSVKTFRYGHNFIDYNYKIEFYSQPNLVYIAGNLVRYIDYLTKDTIISGTYLESIIQSSNHDQLNILGVYTVSYVIHSNQISDYIKPYGYYAFLEVYDPWFYKYWKTKNNGNMSNDIFSFTSGKNISGNVTGDGFGLFIGRAQTKKKLVQ